MTLMLNKCEKDAKGRHYWERIGVIDAGSDALNYFYVIWYCTQCEKYLMRGKGSKDMLE